MPVYPWDISPGLSNYCQPTKSDLLKVIPPCLTVDVLAADVLNKEDKHDTRREEYHMNNPDIIDILSARAFGWKL